MLILPSFLFSVVLLKTCFGSEPTTVTPLSATETIACPGHCVEEGTCSMTLSSSDCDDGLVCCIEQDEGVETTEYAEYFTTAGPSDYSSSPEEYEAEAEVEEQGADQMGSYSISEDGTSEVNPEYTYVFSEESDDFALRRSGEVEDSCPGTCVSMESSNQCDYLLSDEDACPPEAACCMTDEDVQATSNQYNYFVMGADESSVQNEESLLTKREATSSEDSCPGTCVHPSHALFCEQILPEFSCPLDSKCCIKRSTERSSQAIQCTGQCLPTSMQGYCFSPNEIVMGTTTCKEGTQCCMERSSGSRVQPPSIGAMQYPNVQHEAQSSDPAQVVMGHLAVDDDGTVFRVGTNGQVSPLPKVSRIDHLRAKYNKLMVYPRSGGHIVIYSDSTGALYQQFYPKSTYDPQTPFGKSPRSHSEEKATVQKPMWKPVIKRPIEAESSPQDFEDMPEFQQVKFTRKPTDTEKEASQQDFDAFPEEEPQDVVIPDDDDEAPVVESKPSISDGKTGRPTCPGSCMSFFLRFTCFRGHSIYDGFSCPGRSVCCARTADIESHENRLRSLSPYFKESPDTKNSVPNCGIKGKDSQNSVSGKDSLPGEWCWQVAIINVQNQYMCGGALIGDSWIITAAHCVASAMKESQAIFVRSGVTDLKSPQDNNKGQTIRVVSTFIHRNFNSKNLDNNIALLQLQKPVELDDHVCVVCLPTSGQMPTENVKCTVTGYGFVSQEGGMSLKIREAQVPIVDDTECMTNVTEVLVNPFILPSSSFCAGGQGQEDACQGDAGGPLVCEISGHHELIGLVSWTLGCGRNDVPSIYVKVPAFMGWINQVIGSSSFMTALN